MEFKMNTRQVGNYCNISVKLDGVIQDLNLHDTEQIKDAIQQLQDAIDDLTKYL